MQTFEPMCLTVTEFVKLDKELRGKILSYKAGLNTISIGDRILMKLLDENRYKYLEIKNER